MEFRLTMHHTNKKTMKYTLLLAVCFVFGISTGIAQEQNQVKKIEVKGSAEKEITPNEIYFRIALREYKDGSRKITLNHLESELVNAIKKLNLPKDNLEVENIYGYNWNHKKKQPDEFLAIKSFIVKLTDLKQVNDLMANLDPEGINSSGVSSYSHTEIEKYNKALKIEALKNAKEKATYLLEAIGEQLGTALEIQEIDYGYNQPMMSRNFEAKMADAGGYQSDVDFKTIKIKAEVRAVFEIQ